MLLGFRFKYSKLKCLGREKQAKLIDLLKNLSLATRRDKSPGEVNNSESLLLLSWAFCMKSDTPLESLRERQKLTFTF